MVVRDDREHVLVVAGGARVAGVDGAEWAPRRVRKRSGRPARRRAARTAGSRTTPPFGTCSRPASNCGFTSTSARHGAAASGERRRRARACSEMNETSATTQVGPVRQAAAVEVARVGALEHGHARVGAEPLVQLAVADVERRSRRAAPRCSRQSVKPPVEAPRSSAWAPATSQPNASSAGRELGARAGDVGRRRRHLDRGVVGHARAGLRHHAGRRRATCPRHDERPARGRASRRARASTSATSRRSLSARPSGAAVRMAATA